MNDQKITAGRAILAIGIVCGFISFWYTLAFTWDEDFRAVNLAVGPTHSNFHAFREALLALAVNLLLIFVLLRAATIKIEIWSIVLFMAVFYYAGWWVAWPIWGYHAPDIVAELNHVGGTIGGLLGLMMLRPSGKSHA